MCRDFEVGETALVSAPDPLLGDDSAVATPPVETDSPDVIEAGPERPRGLFARAFQRR